MYNLIGLFNFNAYILASRLVNGNKYFLFVILIPDESNNQNDNTTGALSLKTDIFDCSSPIEP